jgi:hypothetical protein
MKIKIPLKLVELETGNFHLIATCTFPDGATGNWAIDTGASKTVFDKNLEKYYSVSAENGEEIHSAGIGEKPVETTLGILSPFSLGKLKTGKMKVALLDLSHINELYKRATDLEICGLIGGDFLSKHHALIDYKRKIMKIDPL